MQKTSLFLVCALLLLTLSACASKTDYRGEGQPVADPSICVGAWCSCTAE